MAIAIQKDYTFDQMQEQQHKDALNGVAVTSRRNNHPVKRHQQAEALSRRRAVKRKAETQVLHGLP